MAGARPKRGPIVTPPVSSELRYQCVVMNRMAHDEHELASDRRGCDEGQALRVDLSFHVEGYVEEVMSQLRQIRFEVCDAVKRGTSAGLDCGTARASIAGAPACVVAVISALT